MAGLHRSEKRTQGTRQLKSGPGQVVLRKDREGNACSCWGKGISRKILPPETDNPLCPFLIHLERKAGRGEGGLKDVQAIFGGHRVAPKLSNRDATFEGERKLRAPCMSEKNCIPAREGSKGKPAGRRATVPVGQSSANERPVVSCEENAETQISLEVENPGFVP